VVSDGEKHQIRLDAGPAAQADRLQPPGLTNQLDRIVLDQLDTVVRQDVPITLLALKTPPLGEDRQAPGPVKQFPGETGNRLTPAEYDDRATLAS
jgi:hypothetical protein